MQITTNVSFLYGIKEKIIIMLHFKRVCVSADFAWVAQSSLHWAGSKMPKAKCGLQAFSNFMGGEGQLLRASPSFAQDQTFPGAAHAGPTPAKHLSTCLTFNTSITHGEVKLGEAAGAEIAVKRKWGGGDLIASLSQWTCLQISFRAWGKMITEANRSMTCYSVLSPAPTFAKERGREWGRSVQFVRCYHT